MLHPPLDLLMRLPEERERVRQAIQAQRHSAQQLLKPRLVMRLLAATSNQKRQHLSRATTNAQAGGSISRGRRTLAKLLL